MKQRLHPIFYSIILLFSNFNFACAQKIQPNTIKQIDSLEQEKNARTPVQQKIESHLLQAARNASGKKTTTAIPLNDGDLDIDNKGLVNVDIAADVTDTLLQKIKKLGGEIIYPSKEYHTIRAKIPLSKVETIAAYTAVKFIQPAAIPHNNKITPTIKMNN